MVYHWPKSLLQRIEVAIRSYLWTGDINKRGFLNIEWKRCCDPLNEGGFRIRSIRLANASFNCKLTWDLLTSSDEQTNLLRDLFFHSNGKPRNTNKASSIRPGIHEQIQLINEGSFWLIGRYSKVNF